MRFLSSAVAIILGCIGAFADETAVCRRREIAEMYRRSVSFGGPRINPDDQIRGFWLLDPACYDSLVDAGFNTFIIQYDENYCEATNYTCNADVASTRKMWLERTMRDGTDYIEQFVVQQYPDLKLDKYMCVSPNGRIEKPFVMDATNAEVRERFRRMVSALVETIPTNPPPSFAGVQSASEVRGQTRPSFTEVFRKRWREASGGMEIPEGCSGRYGPKWQSLPDFPSLRIVSDDYPILRFYRWFYREGDGWNEFLDDVAAIAEHRIGRAGVKMFDPIVRQPAIRGFGSGMTLWNQWHYVYPEPYNVSYIVSEMQAMNRSNPDRQLTMMVQGISYRRALAPKDTKVPNPPAWVADRPNVSYMTTPPDMACEAFWTLFTRRLSGVMLYGWRSLFDMPDEQHPKDGEGYQFTNGETIKAVSKLMNRVGIPLGPLFKAIPERPMEVAVLESFTSAILAGRCDLAYSGPTLDLGTMLTAANLMPQVIYEEDLAALGVPESVRVLVLSQCEVLPESAERAIREFRRRGGIVVGDEVLAPGVAADIDIPLFIRSGNAEDEQRRMRDGARRILDELAPFYRPPVASSTPDIRAYVRSYGKMDFLFAVNDRRTKGTYVGQWGRVFEKGVASQGTISLRGSAGAVYDLVEHKAVPFVSEGGTVRVDVSLDAADGRVFMVTEKPLGALHAETDGNEVRVISQDGFAMIPVGLFADGVKPRYGVVRDGFLRVPFSGKNVRVVNLADGRETPASLVSLIGGGDSTSSAFRSCNGPSAKSAEHPVCTDLPPSQNPGFDHELKKVSEFKVSSRSFVLPGKQTCDAVECRFGKVDRFMKVRINGVLAAVYDPAESGGREFRIEVDRLLKWGAENVIEVQDASGSPIQFECLLVALKII